MGWMMIFATIPIGVLGVLFSKQIKGEFRSLYVISGAMIGVALLLVAAEEYVRHREKRGLHGKRLDEVTWTDTLGASNIKSSYLNLALDVHHEAHVEGVENGTHKITIAPQAGCLNIGAVSVNGVQIGSGPMTVSVKVAASDKTLSTQIWVACE